MGRPSAASAATPADRARAVALYVSGMSGPQVAPQFGVSAQSILHWVRAAGETVRDRNAGRRMGCGPIGLGARPEEAAPRATGADYGAVIASVESVLARREAENATLRSVIDFLRIEQRRAGGESAPPAAAADEHEGLPAVVEKTSAHEAAGEQDDPPPIPPTAAPEPESAPPDPRPRRYSEPRSRSQKSTPPDAREGVAVTRLPSIREIGPLPAIAGPVEAMAELEKLGHRCRRNGVHWIVDGRKLRPDGIVQRALYEIRMARARALGLVTEKGVAA